MIRFYLTPFDDLGEFAEEIEITPDVDLTSIGKLKRTLDNSTYDIGVLRFNNLNLKLHNALGRYSEVESLSSIFRFRRSGAKIRVTWAPSMPAICGLIICGETVLSEEVNIYRGILNDDATKMDAEDQIINFQVLSYDSQFSKVLTPFSSLVGSDTIKDILFKILNQAPITRYATVSLSNINPQVNPVPDSLDWFENKTGKEAIEKLLLVSNSVIYVDDEAIKVTGRAESVEVKKSFYGQASDLGNENIIGVSDFRSGQNRIINVVRFKDGAAGTDPFSIDKWGVALKEIDAEFLTNATKQTNSASSVVSEFKDPRKEFELDTFMDADTVALKFLDKIEIDYPSVVESAGARLPIVGEAVVGAVETPLPKTLWDFKISIEEKFKIMGLEFDLKKETATFQVRAL